MAGKSNEAFVDANMKHKPHGFFMKQKSCDSCEAKRTLTSPCATGTLHSNAVAASFFIYRRCASFAPQFSKR